MSSLIPIIRFVIVTVFFGFVAAGGVSAQAPEPANSGVDRELRRRALETLRAELSADPPDQPWVKVYAGENLASLDYLHGVRDTFEAQFETNGDESPYRIGIWRVLAVSNYDPVRRATYIEQIVDAVLDEDGPDRVLAVESLGRLGYAVGRQDELRAALEQMADGDENALSAYASLILARDDTRHLDRLVSLLSSDNVEVRRTAARALGYLSLDQTDSTKAIDDALLHAAWHEGATAAQACLVGAAFVRGSSEARDEWRPVLYEWLTDGTKDERSEACNALGIAGAKGDLPFLIDRLDDPETEVRVAAATAVLRIGRHVSHRLAGLDWAIIAAYGLGMLTVGWYYSQQTKTTDDYLLGGRNMRPWAAGVSLFVTLMSTISFLSTPGEMIKYGPMFFASIVDFPIVVFIAGWLIIPYIMRLKVTSAYEILEIRLGLSVRMLGSVIFLALRLLWMAVIIYATVTQVLVPLAGIDPRWAPLICLIMGGVTVVYTSMGGLRAVIWTDVVQAAILFGGACLVLLTVTIALGGVSEWWPTAWAESWPEPRWGFETDARVTFGWVLVSAIIWWICTLGSDQMSIQRYLSTRDVRAARRVVITSKASEIVILLFLALIGLALLAYFQANPHMMPRGQTIYAHADQLLPQYIAFGLPVGVTGLIVAGVLAAAMSSLSSGLNSSCSVITIDFIDRFKHRKLTESDRVRLAKIISVIVGAVVVALSFFVNMVSGNLFEVAFKVVNLLTVPLFILFFMAMFVPWATMFGTWIAEICSIATAVCIAYYQEIFGAPGPSFLWIMPGALVVGVVVGLVASLIPIGPGPRKPLSEVRASSAEEAATAGPITDEVGKPARYEDKT